VRKGKVTKHHPVLQVVTLKETLEMGKENILLALKPVMGKRFKVIQ
jgi:hypothetical protein